MFPLTIPCRKAGSLRFGALVRTVLGSMSSIKAKNEQNAKVLGDIDMESELSEEEFKELLQKIDSGLRGLPATAQVCLSGALPVVSALAAPSYCAFSSAFAFPLRVALAKSCLLQSFLGIPATQCPELRRIPSKIVL